MQTEFISPNLHVILIHYPLAMLIAGTLIELFGFLWPKSTFRKAGQWMILIGALSAIPATFSGVYALRDVARVPEDHAWMDVKRISPVLSQPEIWNLLRRHMLYQSIVTGVAALVVVIWLGASDRVRRSLHVTLLMILVATVGVMVSGAWFGGESIYKKGLAVEPVFPIPKADAADATTAPASWTTTKTRAEIMFPPLEQHTIMAGVAIAIALVSIGLSFRKITASTELADDPIVTAGPVSGRDAPRAPPSSVDMSRTFNPDLQVELKPFIPAGRFWMLTFVVALMTSLGGIFVIARDADIIKQMDETPKQIPQLIWNQIKPDKGQKINRLLAHAISGSAIVALPIVLALLTRFAPREKIMLTLVTLLLVGAVAFQVWLGILLLLDSTDGTVYQFNPPGNATVR